MIKPVKATFKPAVGVIVSKGTGVMTMRLPNGKEITIAISGETTPSVVGEVITVFTTQVDGDDGPHVKATGLVRAAKVRERLERFLEGVNDSPGQTLEKATEARSKRVEKIAKALDGHSANHVAILEGLPEWESLPPQARTAIVKALVNSKLGRDKAFKIAAKAREKAGHSNGRGNSSRGNPAGDDKGDKGKSDSDGRGNSSGGNSAAVDKGDKGKPDSHSQGNSAGGSSAADDKGDKGNGKPDSHSQGNPSGSNSAADDKGDKDSGKPDSPGQGNSGGGNSAADDKGDKSNGNSGKGGRK